MAQRLSCSDPTNQVTAEQVRALTVEVLTTHFPLGVVGYRYTDTDLFNLLVAAAAEQRSLESAARQFTTAPSANLVRHYLDTRLFAPLEIGELEARANALLTERRPADLTRHPLRVAMDFTLLPYYGDYAEEPEELRRGPAKAGTTRFHAYATAYVVRAGRRLTLALAFVYADDSLLDIVAELLARLDTLGVRLRRLLLDREFATVAVLRFLDGQPFTSIVALPKRGAGVRADLWVCLKATLLASTPRAERAAARAWLDQSFRLDRLRDLLIEAIKASYRVHTALAYPFPLSPSFRFGGGEIGKY